MFAALLLCRLTLAAGLRCSGIPLGKCLECEAGRHWHGRGPKTLQQAPQCLAIYFQGDRESLDLEMT